MSSVNLVILVGRLGKSPELKHTQSGVPWCRVGLATTESWTNQDGERQEKTEWHNIAFWKKQAENVAKFCSKGSQLYVQGRLETRSWDDQNGQKRYQADVVAEVVKFLDRRREREESPPVTPRKRSGTDPNVEGVFGTDDLGDIPY
ncbi:MAG TPA: single-stranded DNA-binding protein [Oligoflexus sp.]|uniref:single-stranded DNA-binding protein n=1 Tax=Oligoflexus sp. TaxID=1971216 RepID=UPI002D6F91A1|nr:single-stranded DNA-binding protein [Oligoflexus sp.]HYX36900.1 single-stranded DNA-binding protein [Oligoflexus sp.]